MKVRDVMTPDIEVLNPTTLSELQRSSWPISTSKHFRLARTTI